MTHESSILRGLRGFLEHSTGPILAVKAAREIGHQTMRETVLCKDTEVDTQLLSEHAGMLIDADPDSDQAAFARDVMVRLDAGELTPQEAFNQFFKPVEE